MGTPLELVRYSTEDGKFYVGQLAVEALRKVRLDEYDAESMERRGESA